MPGHTTNQSNGGRYILSATGETYNGLVIMVGGVPHSSTGGALEGVPFSQELKYVNSQGEEIDLPISTIDASSGYVDNNESVTPPDLSTEPVGGNGGGQNPVTRTFVSRVTYYREDGRPIPPGTDLHEHADGTIMLGHDPENMGAIVTRTRPMTNTNMRRNTTMSRTMVRQSSNRGRTSGY